MWSDADFYISSVLIYNRRIILSRKLNFWLESIAADENNVLVVDGLEKEYMTKTGPFKAVQVIFLDFSESFKFLNC